VKKKILIVVENAPVPFDPRVRKEASSLHEAGYEVTVLCPRAKGAELGYEMIGGVRVYRHPMPGEGNSALGYLWEYGCAFFWEVLYAWWIYLRHGFHIIQGCNPPDNIFLVAMPFKLFGVSISSITTMRFRNCTYQSMAGAVFFIRPRSCWKN